ncbi:ankyrin repeat domain-containing protein [Aliarcobacter butzleri]|uniref:ankyrin repeat domain-containing protein n=1 Tax=Aliarcobacter butzleri TaxID=28197 RepID=UPI003B224165
MTTNEKLNEVLKFQDIQTLTMMINDGLQLNEVKLIDVLKNSINNKDEVKVDSRFIKMLIENGVQIDTTTNKSSTSILMLLSYLSLDEIIEDFISKGFDINAMNTWGMNSFHWAVAGGEYSTVRLLMEKGADIFAKAEFEVKYYEKTRTSKEKLEKLFNDELIYDNADIKVKKVKISSFSFAFNKYNPQIVKLLLENGFDPNENVINENSFFKFFKKEIPSSYFIENSAVTKVCKKNDTELLKLMIEKGANRFDTSDLELACKNLNFNMIKLLVDNGVEIKEASNDLFDYNLLSYVCKHSAIEPINGNCATYLSIHSDEVFEIIKYLVEHATDINLERSLWEACNVGSNHSKKAYTNINLNIIQYLIDKGADVNYYDHNGKSILMQATEVYNSFELVKLLVENGADVNHTDKYGNTVIMNIHLDPQYEDMWLTNEEVEQYTDDPFLFQPQKILLYLIENGADVNLKNKMGMSALMRYSWTNNIVFVQILLENGADVNVKSEMTAFELAQDDEIKKLIKNTKNNLPQRLVRLLSNFTIDKPIKYTTHDWDFGELKKEYGNFDGYMNAVKKQFDTMKTELEELSPNLYKKIYTFLIEENPDENYSWCSKTHINIGWSSLKGLKEYCDVGNKPDNFILQTPIFYEGRDLTTFKDVINLFKQEIEIRENFKNLETLFTTQKNKLGTGRNSIFNLDLSTAKLNRQFYTDVEKFSNVVDKIFGEIKIRKDFPNLEVITTEFEDRSIEIKIVHIDSISNKSASDLLKEIEDGDFAEIKANLQNLCDWSIESSFENQNFRINYLHSNNVKEIVSLDEKPKGFTHIFRFYK